MEKIRERPSVPFSFRRTSFQADKSLKCQLYTRPFQEAKIIQRIKKEMQKAEQLIVDVLRSRTFKFRLFKSVRRRGWFDEPVANGFFFFSRNRAALCRRVALLDYVRTYEYIPFYSYYFAVQSIPLSRQHELVVGS